MKLKDMNLDPRVMTAVTKMVAERLQNLQLVKQKGGDVVTALLAELVMVEVKLDAAMLLLEENGTKFDNINIAMEAAAQQGTQTAVQIREILKAQKPR